MNVSMITVLVIGGAGGDYYYIKFVRGKMRAMSMGYACPLVPFLS